MTDEGWLMRSLRADPEYVEIEERVKRDGIAAPQIQLLPGNHDETNAKIRALLDKGEDSEPRATADEFTQQRGVLEQIYKAAQEVDDDVSDDGGNPGPLVAQGEESPVEVHPDQGGLF